MTQQQKCNSTKEELRADGYKNADNCPVCLRHGNFEYAVGDHRSAPILQPADNLWKSYHSVTERIDALEAKNSILEAKVSTLENRNNIMQDERLFFFSKAMPKSNVGHSIASKYIDETYGKRCLFCDETNGVTKAHIVAGNRDVDYSVFCQPKYIDNLDVKSPRNFIPLCGTDGKNGTCYNEFDKFLMTLIYNPFQETFEVRCLRESFPKYELCHGRLINVDLKNPPYRRLLAWRTRKCIMEHHSMIRGEVEDWIQLCNFSEKSRSIAKSAETESNSEESGLTYS